MKKYSPGIRIKHFWPVAIVCVSFMLGSVVGCLFAVLMDAHCVHQLSNYLTDFLVLSSENTIRGSVGVFLWSHFRWLLFCLLAALGRFALFFIPALTVARGFLFSFGIGCFIRVFGPGGLIPAIIILGVPAVFGVPGFLFTAIPVLCCSPVFRSVHGLEKVNAGISRNLYRNLTLSISFLFVCVFIEYSLLPVLLPMAANILGFGGVSGG